MTIDTTDHDSKDHKFLLSCFSPFKVIVLTFYTTDIIANYTTSVDPVSVSLALI